MKKVFYSVLVLNTVTVGFVFAGEKNPYQADSLHQSNVVIGIERTRNTSSVMSSTISMPVEVQTYPTVPVSVELAAPRPVVTLPAEIVTANTQSAKPQAVMPVKPVKPVKPQKSSISEKINSLEQSDTMLDKVLNKQESDEFALFEPVKTPSVSETASQRHEAKPETETFKRPTVAPSQPKNATVRALQDVLKGTPEEYLLVVNPSSRVYVSQSDGKVYFRAFEGKLHDNLEVLLSATSAHLPMVYQVSEQHHNPTDVWMSGESVLDILNSLLVNYRDPHPIRANTYANRIVEIYYDKKNR